MFYVNENMSDFLPFEYWQTVANASPRTFSLSFVCVCVVGVRCVWAVRAVCARCPGPKNDKCVGYWLKLRLQLAYFSFNQQANKCTTLRFSGALARPRGRATSEVVLITLWARA